MTTITFKDGVLAADSQATRDNTRTGFATKLFRLDDGERAALLGCAADAYALLDWYRAGKDRPQPEAKEGSLVVVEAGGEIMIYQDGYHQPAPTAPFHAWGSGMDFALGAMWAGASAKEAVEIAVGLDTYSGGPVTVL